jgi:hypothetical protein
MAGQLLVQGMLCSIALGWLIPVAANIIVAVDAEIVIC